MNIAVGPSQRIQRSPRYKWWAYGAIAIGMFLTVMDQSGINIALPEIAEHFTLDIPTVQWISLGYVLSTSALLMPMGRLSDMVGRKRVYMAGFAVFICMGLLAGFSQSFLWLIGAKVVQGIGAAAIQANGMAMITEVFPENERGRAVGLYTAIIGTGAITGPIVGGFLVSGLGWRAIFFAGAPVGLLALLSAMVVLRGRARLQPGVRKVVFDWGGAALSSGALVSFLLAMTNAHRLGWESPTIIAGLALSVVLAAAFIWWELRADNPMLDLSFFKSRVFSMSISARFLSFLGGTSVYFLMPFYLIQVQGYRASKAGLIMVAGSIMMAVMGPISGRLSDKIGTRWLTVFGMASSTCAMLVFSRLTLDSPPYHVVAGMLLSGLGMGSFSSTNTSAILSSLPRSRYGIVSAFVNLTRTSANLTGIALTTTIVTLTMASLGFEPSLAAVSGDEGEGVREAFVAGFTKAFLVSASLMFLAMFLSLVRPDTSTAPAPVAEQAAKEQQPASPGDG